MDFEQSSGLRFPDLQDDYLSHYGGGLEEYDRLVAQAWEALAADPPEVEDAIEAGREAVALRKSDTIGLQALATAYERAGRSDDDIDELFENAARGEPALGWQIMEVLEGFWEERGRGDRAEGAVRLALEVASDDPRCWTLAARHYARREAWTQVRRLLDGAPGAMAEEPELKELAAHARTHEGLSLSPLREIIDALSHVPPVRIVFSHLQRCGSCRRHMETLRATFSEQRASIPALAPVLGPSTTITAHTDDGSVELTLKLSLLESRGEADEWTFEPQGEVPEGIWYLEAWATGPAGNLPLSVARLEAGSILLPASVGGQDTQPAQLRWRLYREEEQ